MNTKKFLLQSICKSLKEEQARVKDKDDRYAGYILISIVFCIFISGCGAHRHTEDMLTPKVFVETNSSGIYHTLKRGETLWKISRLYAVDLSRLVEFNNIPDATKVRTGQKIFIPDSLRLFSTGEGEHTVFKGDFLWPCQGAVTVFFNQDKQYVKNCGLDIKTAEKAPIIAAAHGKVIFTSENMRGYGKTIIVDHSHSFYTIYSSNKKNLVRTGDYVSQGQVIALAGTTGRAAESILHFEVREKNKAKNPLHYLP
ncbi:MAG: peptidoglycan DD-metalloendopeptidase family protein [Candidatus Omnitrophota bacterium]